jgi:hypothetical protein
MTKGELDSKYTFPCCRRTQNRKNRRGQTLHPEEGQNPDKGEEYQQTDLLRAIRHH